MSFAEDLFLLLNAAFWTGRTVKTREGGKNDIGIQIENEPIFTRSKADVAKWVVNDPAL